MGFWADVPQVSGYWATWISSAEVLARLDDALLHDLVEGIQDAGKEGDVGLLVVLGGGRRRQHRRGQQGDGRDGEQSLHVVPPHEGQ